MAKKFDNDAAVQVAEEAFRAGYAAAVSWADANMIIPTPGGERSKLAEDEAWDNFEPSEAIKDLLD